MLVMEYLFKYMSEGAFHFCLNVFLLLWVFVMGVYTIN